MIYSLLALVIFFHLVFLLAIKLKDNSIVDIAWGLGFVIIDVMLLATNKTFNISQVVASMLILIWGLRLSGYIFWRKIGKPEDFRYAAWRKSWGDNLILISYFRIFWLQMLFLIIIAEPLFLLSRNAHYSSLLVAIGVFISLAGLAIEIISDYQMFVFKKSANGGIMTAGLWRYSRHPNYFGEALFWWGIALIAYCPSNYGLELVSPLVITLLLRYVSGVPMLEEKYKNNAQFQAYASKTSIFIPCLPKK